MFPRNYQLVHNVLLSMWLISPCCHPLHLAGMQSFLHFGGLRFDCLLALLKKYPCSAGKGAKKQILMEKIAYLHQNSYNNFRNIYIARQWFITSTGVPKFLKIFNVLHGIMVQERHPLSKAYEFEIFF